MTKFYLLLLVSCFYICFSNSLSAQTNEVNYRNWVRTNQTNKSKKAALVIGNSLYQHVSQLSEPAKDAQTIANALQIRGYDVLICYNLTRNELVNVINDFATKFNNYGEIIVAYAGHGFQIDGIKYILPIDANAEHKWQVSEECLEIDYIYKAINVPQKPKLFVFDACRENPFQANWKETVRLVLPKGMAAIKALQNSLSVFSTQANTVVSDNNQFMELLSQEIEKGGCLDDILRVVSRRVKNNDPNQQINVEGLLDYEFCFSASNNTTSSNSFIDTDGDGFSDQVDHCPKEWGQNNGCPSKKDEFSDNSGTFTDIRDGQIYKWIRMEDGEIWMAENLNYVTPDSWCYNKKSSNCQKYGRLYTWEAAKKACPYGWHLPTKQEWKRLRALYGGRKKAYNALIKDSGFNALLGGYHTTSRDSSDIFYRLGKKGGYWTSSSIHNSSYQPKYYMLFYFSWQVSLRTDFLGDHSCRCVQN